MDHLELGLENQEHELIKTDAKDRRRKEGYKKAARTRRLNATKKEFERTEGKVTDKVRATGRVKATGKL